MKGKAVHPSPCKLATWHIQCENRWLPYLLWDFGIVLSTIKQKHLFSPNIKIMKLLFIMEKGFITFILTKIFWQNPSFQRNCERKCVTYSRICRLLLIETGIAYISVGIPFSRGEKNPHISLEIFYLMRGRERERSKKTEKTERQRMKKENKKKHQVSTISYIGKFSSKNKVSKTTTREIFPPIHVLLIHSNVMWKDLKILEENL